MTAAQLIVNQLLEDKPRSAAKYEISAHLSSDKKVAYLDWLYVPEGNRRSGIGAAAYLKFEKSLPITVKSVEIMAADAGDGPSDAFWLSLGFDYKYPEDALDDTGKPLDYVAKQTMIKRLRI